MSKSELLNNSPKKGQDLPRNGGVLLFGFQPVDNV